MADGQVSQKTKDKIANAVSRVRNLKAERKESNAGIAEVRASMEALGVHKKAFDLAMAYADMDEDKREGFDIAYALVREAVGVPLADDLFKAAQRRQDEMDAKAKATEKQTEADSLFAGRSGQTVN